MACPKGRRHPEREVEESGERGRAEDRGRKEIGSLDRK